MARKKVETTEVLHKEITAEGRAVWKNTKRKIVKKLYPLIIANVLVTFFEMAMLLFCAFALQKFIDGVQATGAVNYKIVGIIIGVLILRCVALYLLNYLANLAYLNGQKYLNVELYKNVLNYHEYLQKVQTGDVISLLAEDATSLGQNFGVRRIYLITSIIETATVLGIIYYYSWVVGIAVTVFYPIYFVVCGIINGYINKCQYKCSKAWSATSQVRLKGIQGWLELAILKKQNFYAQKYKAECDNNIKQEFKLLRFHALEMVVRMMAGTLLPVLCVILCTLPILLGTGVTVSAMLIVYMMSGYLEDPLNSLTMAVRSISEDNASCQRLSDIIYYEREKEGQAIESIDNIKIDINKFTYGGDEELLKNCRVDIKKGDLVAVRGDSGCGKTTLFKLLIKQNPYENLDGKIEYNGTPVNELARGKLYDKLQYVSQNYFVFEDTLYNNLCMGDEFSKESIDEAIKISCLDGFVKEYGLQTVLEENGKNISQGQLQRVCIARAILRQPDCLLLDEPTSALDEATGDELMNNIVDYTKKRGIITFVISHKNEIVERADKNILLSKEIAA